MNIISGNNLPLEQVIDGCKSGNIASQELLYKQFYGYAMTISRLYTYSIEDAVSILNDSFLKVFTAIQKKDFNDSTQFKSWLRRIIINTAIDSYRKNVKHFYQEDIEVNRRIGIYGAALLPQQARILTHCNAGALATCGWGTALGVVRQAFLDGRLEMVYADETRPLLQGARLTAWELIEDNIPVTLITDNMAAWVMQTQHIDSVIVGADRIAANGDTANKIGTYGVALAAKYHQIPFYIAAPISTFDFTLETGKQIPIEERSADEVRLLHSVVTAPQQVNVFNPAFDVTPGELITGIITEYGVISAPYIENIKKLQKILQEED